MEPEEEPTQDIRRTSRGTSDLLPDACDISWGALARHRADIAQRRQRISIFARVVNTFHDKVAFFNSSEACLSLTVLVY